MLVSRLSVSVTPLEPADLMPLSSLQPPDWGSIVPAHEIYLSSAFSFSFKFCVNSELVGVGTIIIHQKSAWLAHIIVHPEHRKKGLGELITRTLIDAAINKGCKVVSLIATESGEPVYKKCGFFKRD